MLKFNEHIEDRSKILMASLYAKEFNEHIEDRLYVMDRLLSILYWRSFKFI